MLVSSDESRPKTYFLNSDSTVDTWGEAFFSYIEFWTLNRIEDGWPLATGTGWAEGANAVVPVANDIPLQ